MACWGQRVRDVLSGDWYLRLLHGVVPLAQVPYNLIGLLHGTAPDGHGRRFRTPTESPLITAMHDANACNIALLGTVACGPSTPPLQQGCYRRANGSCTKASVQTRGGNCGHGTSIPIAINCGEIAGQLRQNCGKKLRCRPQPSSSVTGHHFWTGGRRCFFASHNMAHSHHNSRGRPSLCDCTNVLC